MTTAILAPAATEIVYDRESRDFALYIEGQLVGFAANYADGDAQINAILAERGRRGKLADEVGCTVAQVDEALAHFAACPVTAEERATLAEIDAEAEAGYAALAAERAEAEQDAPTVDSISISMTPRHRRVQIVRFAGLTAVRSRSYIGVTAASFGRLRRLMVRGAGKLNRVFLTPADVARAA